MTSLLTQSLARWDSKPSVTIGTKSTTCMMLLALSTLVFFVVSRASAAKGPTGIVDGRLAPCPGSSNCVCSEVGTGPPQIEPFQFTDAPDAAWLRLQQAVKSLGGAIEQNDSDYIWATFRSAIFRFVDDTEFRMDAANHLIHVRSASRIGYSDFGVNRKRVESLRRRFDTKTTE